MIKLFQCDLKGSRPFACSEVFFQDFLSTACDWRVQVCSSGNKWRVEVTGTLFSQRPPVFFEKREDAAHYATVLALAAIQENICHANVRVEYRPQLTLGRPGIWVVSCRDGITCREWRFNNRESAEEFANNKKNFRPRRKHES